MLKKLLTTIILLIPLLGLAQTPTQPVGSVVKAAPSWYFGTDTTANPYFNGQFYNIVTGQHFGRYAAAFGDSRYINIDQKAAPNGVATLDGGGKVPFSQLPANLLIYKGQWNPATNTPTLVNGTGTTGDVWEASVDGDHNFGAGTIHFLQGDFAIYDGIAWQLSAGTNRVTSVNGYQGIVTLNTDDVGEGTTNKYFTDARSRAALSFAPGSGSYNSTTGVITIPTNTNQLTNGAGFITGYTETDPTVPAYAKSLTAFSVIKASTDALYQPQISGTGFVKATGTTISYDNSTYLTTSAAGSYAYRSSGLAELTGATFNGAVNIQYTSAELAVKNDATKSIIIGGFDGTSQYIKAIDLGTGFLPLKFQAASFDFNAGINVTGTGTFTDGSRGLTIRAYTGGGSWGAVYPSNVTASGTNYALLTDGTTTIVNAPSSTILGVGGTSVLTATSTGISVIGAGTFSGGASFNGAFTGQPLAVKTATNSNFRFSTTGGVNQLANVNDAQSAYEDFVLGNSALSISGTTNDAIFAASVTATSFIIPGGTSSQFLKADGSVDNNTYLTANQLISFTPTGDVTGSTSGTTALVPVLTIGAGKVTNTMLAGGIDLATKVTGVLPSANSSVSLLASFYTLTGNSGTTPTDIYSYTIPANTLSADGDFIDGSYTLAVGVQASTIDNIEINFAGQTVANFGPFSHANASDGIITIVLKRISSSDAQCSATWLDNGGSVNTGSVDFDLRQISSVNFTTTNVLKVIATGGSTNSIAFYDGYYRLNK